jgi:hypothetical protein
MISVLRLLQDLDTELKVTGEAGGIEDKICIVRSKRRFARPTSGGWADIMVNFHFKDDNSKHICEVQLVHSQLYGVRKHMGAHKTHGDFRAAKELCEKVGANPEDGGDASVQATLIWQEQESAPAMVADGDMTNKYIGARRRPPAFKDGSTGRKDNCARSAGAENGRAGYEVGGTESNAK